MKRNVHFCREVWVISVFVTALCLGIAGVLWAIDAPQGVLTLAFVMLITYGVALFYMPIRIAVDQHSITVYRPLWFKNFELSCIESVETASIERNTMRLWGSGEFWGFYGWFRSKTYGRYFAYYGDPAECFFVRLKDGRGYMLGCSDAAEVVAFIQGNI